MFVKGYDYYQIEDDSTRNVWFEKFLPDFRWIPREQLPKGISLGSEYTTVTINTLKYLKWLQSQLEALGGKVRRDNIRSIYDAADSSTSVIVNCSGLATRWLDGVNDLHLYPTRGQTVLVRAPNIKWTITRFGRDFAYIIPRENGEVILGGTMQAYDNTPTADTTTARTILQQCYDLSPELSNGKGWQAIEVIGHNVGLRPSRTGGVRVETETWINPKGAKVIICHNYGHGGYGYQSSWGTASDAVEQIALGVKVELGYEVGIFGRLWKSVKAML
jgi:glycine/D-amino acid oxidase-like deaminating enzyme